MSIYLFVLLIMAQSCQQHSVPKDSKYLRMVGDILHDATLDEANFQLCNEKNAKQYHNLNEEMQYEGEKYKLVNTFKTQFSANDSITDSGMIRIRFLVNCKGETGRFRVMGAGYDYQEKQFNPYITDQLLTIAKNLKGWKMLSDKTGPKDYYQYLIFKMNGGKITEILP